MLKAVNLAKSYKGRKVVRNVAITVEQGEIVGLLGPNGAGKTTTLMLLMGILKPTIGEVTILNHNVYNSRKMVSRKINFASPFVELPHRLTVKQNLTVYGH